MKKLVMAIMLLGSNSSYAFVGYPNEACKATKQEIANMREQAVTGEENADTQISAQMDECGPIPWDDGREALATYWNKCADIVENDYNANCNLP